MTRRSRLSTAGLLLRHLRSGAGASLLVALLIAVAVKVMHWPGFTVVAIGGLALVFIGTVLLVRTLRSYDWREEKKPQNPEDYDGYGDEDDDEEIQ